jgi:hypothetical protein
MTARGPAYSQPRNNRFLRPIASLRSVLSLAGNQIRIGIAAFDECQTVRGEMDYWSAPVVPGFLRRARSFLNCLRLVAYQSSAEFPPVGNGSRVCLLGHNLFYGGDATTYRQKFIILATHHSMSLCGPKVLIGRGHIAQFHVRDVRRNAAQSGTDSRRNMRRTIASRQRGAIAVSGSLHHRFIAVSYKE